ncbi:MAG TPA: class I SAM-dependent methyltransferase [Acidobacteria bacterium]|nr:class I SAM-dependent methyltransferase [Acidobacteriota bacterium]
MTAAALQVECPVCTAGALKDLELRRSLSGRQVRIALCPECLVLVNTDSDRSERLQQEGSRSFYGLSPEQIAELPRALVDAANLVRSLLPAGWTDLREKTFLEFGSGRGLLPIAAAHLGFARSWGVDLNLETFEQVSRHLPVPGSVRMVRELDVVEGAVDLVVLWHTLEHIPRPAVLLRRLAERTRVEGWIVVQVPQYCPEYICETHHHFYTEPALTRVLEAAGYAPERVAYDLDNAFIAAWARRTPRGAASPSGRGR